MLETPRLRLRLLDGRDRPLFHGLYCDDRVMATVGPPLTRAAADAAFARLCGHNLRTSPGHRFWRVSLHDDTDVGLCALQRQDVRAELGVMLLPAFWRQAMAREAFGVLLPHAFTDPCLRVIHVQRRDDAQAQVMHRLVVPFGFARVPAAPGEACWRLPRGALLRPPPHHG